MLSRDAKSFFRIIEILSDKEGAKKLLNGLLEAEKRAETMKAEADHAQHKLQASLQRISDFDKFEMQRRYELDERDKSLTIERDRVKAELSRVADKQRTLDAATQLLKDHQSELSKERAEFAEQQAQYNHAVILFNKRRAELVTEVEAFEKRRQELRKVAGNV